MRDSADGKMRFEHEGRARGYDRDHPVKKTAATGKGEHSESGGEHEEKDIHSVVAEHGKANKMVMHSHHADGHVHSAEHHDAGSAHAHIDAAMGEGQQEPDGDETGMPGMSVPGMSAM